MADFCTQCTLDTFGKHGSDLSGLNTLEEQSKGLYPVVICEGCGIIQVNHNGDCISPNCLKHHGDPTNETSKN